MHNLDRTPRKLAQKALDGAWDGQLPVRPERFSEVIKVTITSEGRTSRHPIILRKETDYNLRGFTGYADFIPEDPEQPFLIVFNKDCSWELQRYTIAHCLGHIMLGHIVYNKKLPPEIKFGDYDQEEIDANKFARSLLIPKQKILDYIEVSTSIEQLSKVFGVRKYDISQRLKELKVI